MNLKNLKNRVADNNANYSLESKIRQCVPGIYKIEATGRGTYVYTENCFADTKRLNEWLNITGVANIEVNYRYDRTHGLVYVFQNEDEIGK